MSKLNLKLAKLGLATGILLITSGCASLMSDNPRDRSISTIIADEELELAAVKSMFKSDDLWNKSDIDIVSFNRTILLVGQTPTNTLKQKAGELVQKLEDVKKVYNEIRVAAPASSLTYVSDLSLTSKVKTSLFLEDDFNSSNIKVLTEDGEVFLMGLVTSQQATRAIEVARNISGVKRVIQAFEIIE
ncbi:MAG: BON domain-containing protein [Gammaproteobacteria bacterium]|nr:BON domain-containing protein [Gammaproteobacteria bacterium]